MKRLLVSILVVSLAYSVSGCASIAHGTTQAVPVNSSPTGASVTVNCGNSTPSAALVTPTTVLLKRGPKNCNLTLSKAGYEDASIGFVRKMSGWFWGNILFGGVIGMIIDGADGAIYNRAPESVSLTLAKSEAATIPPAPRQ